MITKDGHAYINPAHVAAITVSDVRGQYVVSAILSYGGALVLGRYDTKEQAQAAFSDYRKNWQINCTRDIMPRG